jgi:PAS domain S-box-containing protein
LGLTGLSYTLSPPPTVPAEIANPLICLVTILLTTLLALQAKKAAAALEEQASLLNQTHDSIFVRDMNEVITYWNRGAQEFYGWRAEEAIGKSSHELLKTIFPMPLHEIRAELLRTSRWEGELKHYTADGTEVTAASRWALQLDSREQPIAILETNNDITERKRREDEIKGLNEALAKRAEGLDQQLAKRAAELEATNKELESFAYSVSHDLRAPLRHVVGFAELLQRQGSPSLDDKSRRYVGMILEGIVTLPWGQARSVGGSGIFRLLRRRSAMCPSPQREARGAFGLK